MYRRDTNRLYQPHHHNHHQIPARNNANEITAASDRPPRDDDSDDSGNLISNQSWYCILCGLLVVLAPFQYGYKIAELNSIQGAITNCQDGDSAGSPLAPSQRLPYCLPMTDAAFGLSTSMFAIGGFLGSLVGGQVANQLGRRGGLRWNNIGLILGSLLEGLAVNPEMLMVGRMIAGFSSAISIVIAPMYLSEIATVQRRGSMNLLNQTAIVFGLLAAQCLGFLFNSQPYWRLVVGMGTIISVIHALLLLFVVESPKYLATNGYILEAKMALMGLRDKSNIENELSQWNRISRDDGDSCDIDEEREIVDETRPLVNIRHRHLSIFTIWRRPECRFPLFMIIFLQISQQMSGINVVFFLPHRPS